MLPLFLLLRYVAGLASSLDPRLLLFNLLVDRRQLLLKFFAVWYLLPRSVSIGMRGAALVIVLSNCAATS